MCKIRGARGRNFDAYYRQTFGRRGLDGRADRCTDANDLSRTQRYNEFQENDF
jgi:hypothetical protein